MLFRYYSSLAHPSEMGLHRVTDDLPDGRSQVGLERESEEMRPYAMATVVFGLALMVASEALGWPTTDEVDTVFATFPT